MKESNEKFSVYRKKQKEKRETLEKFFACCKVDIDRLHTRKHTFQMAAFQHKISGARHRSPTPAARREQTSSA